ncbi:hypothetical protein DFP72DRAFT_954426 [Ephemerocybe angulata]|uniref:Uncharacterized protein n=1 Tax=Ephemerocybe angulata TaxID=980116 RepID=A0A8H6MFX2_9AGAR|nr:hypothetical protein DFP72DRAFT_954426 [Tulosesus angulatus]
MPTTAALVRSLSSVLDKAPDAPSLPELLRLVDEYVAEAPQAIEAREVLAKQLEDEVVSLHIVAIDYSSVYQLEVLLAFQYHLIPILPPTAIISWFEPVLRPALREPHLPTASLNHAKELIISALQKTHEPHLARVGDFRRRLLELYLLDAYNELSGPDVLEWASLSQDERERRTRWKANLQDILIAYAVEEQEAFFTEVDQQFQVPTQRLQLLMLLNEFTSSTRFASTVPVLASHKLMKSLANCLFLDNSSTVATSAVLLIVKFLPYFAVHARAVLQAQLPKLCAIMARIMCWKERPPAPNNPLAPHDEDFERELYNESSRTLHPREDINWKRLQMVFTAEHSPPPTSRQYFSILYYLYPSNVIKFIRTPALYLQENELKSPYVEDWNEAFDIHEIKRKSENFVREHICHPFLIWSNADQELSQPPFWDKYDVGRIVSEATMLDIRYLAVGLRERYNLEGREPAPGGSVPSSNVSVSMTDRDAPQTQQDSGGDPVRFIRPIDLSSGKVVISLQDMIEASVALKSNIDLEIIKPVSPPKSGFLSRSATESAPAESPVEQEGSSGNNEGEGGSSGDKEGPSHVAQAISGLQREVLLLRNELNFELWHSRENSKHIGRLYKDRILMRTAESERQGLYNKLRRYRAQVVALETDLREVKETSANAKNGYADWAKELQGRLKELREEKKRMSADLSNAQAAENDLKALFEAQGKRLADALQENFILQTEKKEHMPKVERLGEYEQQIEELTKMRQIWEDDSRKFTEQREELDRLHKENEALGARVEELERAHEGDEARDYRRQIQSLELRLAQMENIEVGASEQKLADENAVLKTEIEELQSIVATLKEE